MNSHMVREGFASYYVVPRLEEYIYEERIIQEQNCKIILPFEIRRVDETSCYYYKVSGMFSLRARMDGAKISMDEMVSVYQKILAAVEELESFLLPAEGLILDSHVIFYDDQRQMLRFCYQPGKDMDLVEQLRILTEEFLEIMSYEDQEMVSFMYQIHDQLTKGVFPKNLLMAKRAEEDSTQEKQEEVFPSNIDRVETTPVLAFEQAFSDEEEEVNGTKWKVELLVSAGLDVIFILLLCYFLVAAIRIGWTQTQMKFFIATVILMTANTVYMVRKAMEKPVQNIRTTIFKGEMIEK